MNIVILGARGDVGSRILSEALDRGHSATAIVRGNADSLESRASLTTCAADALDTNKLTQIIAGHDAVISALRPAEGQEDLLVALTRSVLTAAAACSTRALIVGGAASLKVPNQDGHTVLTAPGFLPEGVIPIARACQAQYELCLVSDDANWTYFCPPAILVPGRRTGRFRIGSDTLVTDDKGHSEISMEDFAAAMIDEAEHPQHIMRRFTAAY